MGSFVRIGVAIAVSITSVSSWGGVNTISVNPPPQADLSAVAFDAKTVITRSANTTVHLTVSCFPTNLRQVANPIAQNTLIYGRFDFDGIPPFTVIFPSRMVEANGDPSPAANLEFDPAAPPPSGTRLGGHGNVVVIEIPGTRTATVTASQVNLIEKLSILRGINFEQYGAVVTGEHRAANGPVTSQVTWSVANDSRMIEINASFPAEVEYGFCGCIVSPLMVFFDDKRPTFAGKTGFMYSDNNRKTHWPERDSAGFFLAVDKNKNGRIDNAFELFSDRTESNGFEALKSFDQNSDGRIDEKDEVFKNLLLWRDKNADGVSQKRELIKFATRASSIDLGYKREYKPFGQTAEYHFRSRFTFRGKDGKETAGEILDIYFREVPRMANPQAKR